MIGSPQLGTDGSSVINVRTSDMSSITILLQNWTTVDLAHQI